MSRTTVRLSLALALLASATPLFAQYPPPVRGQYTPGMSATNSGTMPEAGLTFANFFLFYSFDQLKDAEGNAATSVSGDAAVAVDIALLEWVSTKKILGGTYAAAIGVPFATSALTAANLGSIGGAGGVSNLYVQPLLLGWKLARADLTGGYAFFAPTGKFTAGASDNVGTGYWTNAITAGQTVYLTKNKGTTLSAFEMYEFHGKQDGSDIKPGNTFNIDYSLMQFLPLDKDMTTLLQVGLVGYAQHQTTDALQADGSPFVVPGRYGVNALGGALNVLLPKRGVLIGFKYFGEMGNASTVQGYSIQLNGAVTF